jgi:hypothetical protein
MMAYATATDVQARLTRTMSADEQNVCNALLQDAADMIDAVKPTAEIALKKLASIRMVIRAIGDGSASTIPIGATQGSMSALGYSQSWTVGSGSVGELYISKAERTLLGIGNAIGSYSPLQELAETDGNS